MIATGVERRDPPSTGTARHARAFHAQVVAHDGAGEAELAAQDVASASAPKSRPAAHRPSGRRDVRRHHAGERRCQPVVRAARRRRGSLVERCVVDRPARHASRPWRKPCAGKCLPQLAMPERSRPCIRLLREQRRRRARSRWKARSPITLAAAVVEVEHRREAEVDAAGAQLGAEHVAGGGRGVGGTHRRLRIHSSPSARIGRQVREAVGAEALHAAAFVVDADQRCRAGSDLISAVSSVSWRRSCQLRAKRIRPPVERMLAGGGGRRR